MKEIMIPPSKHVLDNFAIKLRMDMIKDEFNSLSEQIAKIKKITIELGGEEIICYIREIKRNGKNKD